MSEPASKGFDCVKSAREIRDRLSPEIADMSCDELTRWLRSHRYSDLLLQRLADEAYRRAGAADRPSASR